MDKKFKEVIQNTFAEQLDVNAITNLHYTGGEAGNYVTFDIKDKTFQVKYTVLDNDVVEISKEFTEITDTQTQNTDTVNTTETPQPTEQNDSENISVDNVKSSVAGLTNDENQDSDDLVDDSSESDSTPSESQEENRSDNLMEQQINTDDIITGVVEALNPVFDNMLNKIESVFESLTPMLQKLSENINKMSDNSKSYIDDNKKSIEENVSKPVEAGETGLDNVKSHTKPTKEELIEKYGLYLGNKMFKEL